MVSVRLKAKTNSHSSITHFEQASCNNLLTANWYKTTRLMALSTLDYASNIEKKSQV